MVKKNMISSTGLPIVRAVNSFLDKYFDDEILSITFNSSEACKQKTDKGYYKVDFVYESEEDKIPAFLESGRSYVNTFKKEFSEWLSIPVKYFYFEWNFVANRSDKEKGPQYSFNFCIELRV